MKNQPSVVLNNGVEMPLLGLGLFRITNENGGFSQCIHDALEEGYRFFDTAEYYENEKDLGKRWHRAACIGKNTLSRPSLPMTILSCMIPAMLFSPTGTPENGLYRSLSDSLAGQRIRAGLG